METASAAFVPRSKKWWPSSRRRRSGCHFRAFRENQSHILLTFVNPFNSFLRCFHDNFHHPCVRLEVQLGLRSGKIDEISVMLSCFPFSWASFGVVSNFYQKRTLLISFPLHVFALSPGSSWKAAFLSSQSSILLNCHLTEMTKHFILTTFRCNGHDKLKSSHF